MRSFLCRIGIRRFVGYGVCCLPSVGTSFSTIGGAFVAPAARRAFAAEASDAGHMGTIGTDALAALSTGRSCFVRRELMGGSLFMGGFSTLAGNLSLPFTVH